MTDSKGSATPDVLNEIKRKDSTKLKHVECEEKNPLPSQEGINLMSYTFGIPRCLIFICGHYIIRPS